METWIQITDFPDYEVSNLGRVKSHKYKISRIMKPRSLRDGYLSVILVNEKGRSQKLVHRLVVQEHIGLDPDLEIDHIDRNRTNNRINNLNLIPRLENRQKGRQKKVVVQFLETGQTKIFGSVEEVGKFYGVKHNLVSRWLSGSRNPGNRNIKITWHEGNHY
jgi:hypothetical protein